jgi:hypothetical protein
MAVVYRKEGPQRKLYAWESDPGADDDVPDGPDAYWRNERKDGPALSEGGQISADNAALGSHKESAESDETREGNKAGIPEKGSILDIRYIIVPGPGDDRDQEKPG